ncbi:hypothetical protein DM01DRAFT_1367578 [Hesseltinella vesiculosa]|uniref:Phosphatase activator n=1 Tax=Hesseltinella vesiculosa TaxID=101127 RepID=A0A1X2GER0_9FUNG|nr:hypothetical protein DM01DRAFT_1367578 [Hesseltinella vesiculosa]
MASESPIAQVPDPSVDYDDDLIYQQQDDDDGFEQDAIPQILKLDLRGVRMELDRDTLVSLPESLLIAMFPNGLILGRQDDYADDDYDRQAGDSQQRHPSANQQQRQFTSNDEDPVSTTPSSSSSSSGSAGQPLTHDDDMVTDDDDFQVTYVDFDPVCLEYVLRYYRKAQQMSMEAQQKRLHEQHPDDDSINDPIHNSPAYYPLLDKQPIIVLREELEYFCVPTKKNLSVPDMASLKLQCGQFLRQRDEIFAALQKSIARENNLAEQHLIDMLCDAGFSRNDRWGHRALEPTRTCIISMGLVLLKTTGPDNHMATAQKLLLFWRKPARKCWWDGNSEEINGQTVRLWARRTWTLELALL